MLSGSPRTHCARSLPPAPAPPGIGRPALELAHHRPADLAELHDSVRSANSESRRVSSRRSFASAVRRIDCVRAAAARGLASARSGGCEERSSSSSSSIACSEASGVRSSCEAVDTKARANALLLPQSRLHRGEASRQLADLVPRARSGDISPAGPRRRLDAWRRGGGATVARASSRARRRAQRGPEARRSRPRGKRVARRRGGR